MDFSSNFNIFSQEKPVNKDISIIYTPSLNVVSYQYRIFKNASESLTLKNGALDNPTLIYKDYVTVSGSAVSNISLSMTGVYKLEIIEKYVDGTSNMFNSGFYVIDKEAPKIEINDYRNQIYEYRIGQDDLDVLPKIVAYDNYSGNVSNKVSNNLDSVNFKKAGIYDINYTVLDDAGNEASKIVKVNVVNNNIDVVHTWQIIILISMIPVLVYLYFYNHAIKLEKRLSKYSVEPLASDNFSLVDKALKFYLSIIKFLKKIYLNSYYITRHSRRFDKYVGIVDNVHKDSVELMASKTVVAFIVLALAIIVRTVQFKILAVEEYFIPLILGYLLPNFYYTYKYQKYYSRLENDLLQAIIVMNNAFKSGRSITQAIELVTHELDGPIAYEFNLMYTQLQLGLSLDVVFENFSKRIKIEEVSYLTASLSILNKTGGNIIKVFSSIEKTLFNKKKLKLELKSMTGSSKIIMYLLSALPIFLIVVIGVVNPDYYLPLYTSKIGFILMGIILAIYLSYIVVIRKIMRVRM